MADLVHPYGHVVSVPDEQVDQALSEGFTPATAEESALRQQEVEFGGWGGAATATALGAASGATLGLSDAVLSSVGYGKEVRGYAAVNPELHTTGQVLGSIAGAKIPLAPANLAMRAGRGVQASLGGGRLAAVAGMAAEGALFGAGEGISELARSDDAVTGEQLAAVLLRRAGTGAAFGAGFGLSSAALARASKRAAAIGNEAASPLLAAESSAARKALSEAGERGTSRVVAAWDATSAKLGASRPGAIKRLLEKARDGRRGIELANDWRKSADTAAGSLVDDLKRLAPKTKAPGVSETRRLLTDAADDILRTPQASPELAEVATQKAASDLAEKLAPGAPGEVAQEIRTAVRSQLDETLRAVNARDDLASLGASGPTSALLGTTVGAATGGPLGAVAGAVVGAAAHPEAVIQKIATVDSLLASFSRSSGGTMRSFFRGAEKTPTIAPKIASSVVGRREPRAKFSRSVKQAQSLVARAPAVEQQVSHVLRPVAAVAPRAARAASSKVIDVSRYLARRAPDQINESGHTTSASMSEIASYLRSEEVATNPLKAVELLKSGELSTEHVEALRELWPGVYADMQREALDGMLELAADGKQLPYQKRLQLGLLLGLDTDPTLTPDVLNALQSGYSAPPTGGSSTGAPQQTSRIPNLSQAYKEPETVV